MGGMFMNPLLNSEEWYDFKKYPAAILLLVHYDIYFNLVKKFNGFSFVSYCKIEHQFKHKNKLLIVNFKQF